MSATGSAARDGGIVSWLWQSWTEAFDLSHCFGSRRLGTGRTSCAEAARDKWSEFLGSDEKALSLERLTFAHASQLVYAASAETMQIVTPYINEKLGGDIQAFATLQSASAGLQIVGGVAVGCLQDRWGTKFSLFLAHGSTLACAALLSRADSWNGLVLSVIPATTMHGFQAASQIAVRCSAHDARSVSLGRVAMSYGIGWFAGAVLMSKLTDMFDSRQVLALVIGSEAMMLSTIWVFYPSDLGDGNWHDDARSSEDVDSGAGQFALAPGSSASGVSKIWRVVQTPGVRPMLLFKVGICISGGLIVCMVPQFALDPFGFTTAQTSRLMLLASGLQLVSQGVIVPAFKSPSMRQMHLGALLTLGGPLFSLAALPPSGAAFSIAIVPMSIGWHCLNMSINAALSCSVPKDLTGTMIGLSLVPMTSAFLISPMLAAVLFKTVGFQGLASAACASLIGTHLATAGVEYFDRSPDQVLDVEHPTSSHSPS